MIIIPLVNEAVILGLFLYDQSVIIIYVQLLFI